MFKKGTLWSRGRKTAGFWGRVNISGASVEVWGEQSSSGSA